MADALKKTLGSKLFSDLKQNTEDVKVILAIAKTLEIYGLNREHISENVLTSMEQANDQVYEPLVEFLKNPEIKTNLKKMDPEEDPLMKESILLNALPEMLELLRGIETKSVEARDKDIIEILVNFKTIVSAEIETEFDNTQNYDDQIDEERVKKEEEEE